MSTFLVVLNLALSAMNGYDWYAGNGNVPFHAFACGLSLMAGLFMGSHVVLESVNGKTTTR
jgi:hypothetical protein